MGVFFSDVKFPNSEKPGGGFVKSRGIEVKSSLSSVAVVYLVFLILWLICSIRILHHGGFACFVRT